MQCTVTAVVVSYNREVLLAECLDGLANQTRPIDRLVVIDNASTDGARAVLRKHTLTRNAFVTDVLDDDSLESAYRVPDSVRTFISQDGTVTIHELNRNVGGAGGFCAGIAQAVVEDNRYKTAEQEISARGIQSAHAMSAAHGMEFTDSTRSTECADSADNVEFVWLMDDDTIPTPTALEELLGAVDRCVAVNGLVPTVLGSRASWIDGREHLMNKPRERTWITKGHRYLPLPIRSTTSGQSADSMKFNTLSDDISSELSNDSSDTSLGTSVDDAHTSDTSLTALQQLSTQQSVAVEASLQQPSLPEPPVQQPYQVRSLSFVSCLINADAVRVLQRLPKSAYFLWNDDYEFTTGLLRHGIGYYVPQSEVVHKTKVFGSSDADPGERFYQEVRNKLWLLRFSRKNFSTAEFIEFLLKTVRRWALTWWRSQHRDVIMRCLKNGLRDGLGSKPASNHDVFEGFDTVQKLVDAVEHTANSSAKNAGNTVKS